MAYEKFESRKLTGAINVACKYDDGTVRHWNEDKETICQHISFIVNSFVKQGYKLTLRQLHYQLVTRNWIINHDTAYKKLGNILDDMRYSGKIDWSAIEDRGRIPYLQYWLRDVDHAMQDAIDTYKNDLQDEQKVTLELWTEKDAISGILRDVTDKYHIKLVVNKGYTSSSAAYGAYKRCVENITAGKKFTILYFGDHDPSGLDMIRDIRERLELFLINGDRLTDSDDFNEALLKWWDDEGYDIYTLTDRGYASDSILALIEREDDDLADAFAKARVKMFLEEKEWFNVIPIGLTMEQIKKYKLPQNPTKLTDSRADKYIKQFGKICWEVDALEPATLVSIVETHIQKQIDIDLFNRKIVLQEKGREELKAFFKKKKK